MISANTSCTTPTPPLILREDFGTPKIWADSSPAGTQKKKQYDPETWLYEGSTPKKDRRQASPATHHAGGGHGKDRGGEAGKTHRVRDRSDAAGSALRLPGPEAALLPATRRRWSSATAAFRKDVFLKVAETLLQRFGAGEDGAHLLRRGLDAAFERRADHPRGGDSATAAGKYRPARRRHSGAARPCLHSGLHRYSHALRHSARLSAHAVLRGRCQRRWRSTSRSTRPQAGLWSNFDKYFVSLLKAWYGDAATAENELGLRLAAARHRRPLRTSATGSTWRTARWKACSSWARTRRWARPTAGLQRTALAKLKWLVVRDMVETETASFWNDSPEVERGELDPEEIANRSLPASLQRDQPRKPAASPTRSGCCSTTRKRSIRRAMPQRNLVHVSPRTTSESESRARTTSAQCGH